jgi:hypothetical protein
MVTLFFQHRILCICWLNKSRIDTNARYTQFQVRTYVRTSPPSRAECHEIREPKPPGTLWATPGLLRDTFYVRTYVCMYVCM